MFGNFATVINKPGIFTSAHILLCILFCISILPRVLLNSVCPRVCPSWDL